MTNTLRRTQSLNLWFQPENSRFEVRDRSLRTSWHAQWLSCCRNTSGWRLWYQERLMLKFPIISLSPPPPHNSNIFLCSLPYSFRCRLIFFFRNFCKRTDKSIVNLCLRTSSLLSVFDLQFFFLQFYYMSKLNKQTKSLSTPISPEPGII